MAATVPFKPAPKASGEQDQNDPVLKEMRRLVDRAKQDRAKHQSRISDCYKYALPHRHRFSQQGGHVPDLDVIFDETVGTVLEDFAADMLNTFTPQKNNWLEEHPTTTLDIGAKRQIADMLKARQKFVFDEMARSNIYQALQEGYQDLGPGTMAMLIQDIDPAKPLHCEAIAIPDLLITRGPYGYVDGQFRARKYFREEIKRLWPNANMAKLGPEPQDGNLLASAPEIEVTDGCWRDWSDLADESYTYAVVTSDKILWKTKWSGPGSCPFITARWARDSTTAWGFGPTYRTLPAIKTLNRVRFLSLKNYDKQADPVVSYEDDGVINVDNGVEPGKWLPREVGSEAPEVIESKIRLDVQMFELNELRSTVKRAHYQDRPEQLGKTPPTAFQWADERAERARRMGTPATNLVHELQYAIYRRFVYLLDRRGVLPAVTLDERVVTLEPQSPLLRAQEQEEVIRLDRFAELLAARFGPQIAMIVINVVKYAHRLAELLGIDQDLLRDETQIMKAIELLMPVLQSTSAPGGEIAPPALGTIAG